jgi:hypothetical protein
VRQGEDGAGAALHGRRPARPTAPAGFEDGMRIESGPTRERKIRTSLVFLMVAVFALWFAYDGWYGWPAENLRENLEQIPSGPDRDRAMAGRPVVYASVNADSLPAAEKACKQVGRAAQRAALETLYGGPPSVETPNAWYYFGPAYRVVVGLDKIQPEAGGRATVHKDLDLAGQKFLAIALGGLSVYLLWFTLNVRRTRLVLDDAGLTYRGKGPIAWDDMTSLDVSRFNDKGWVDLHYDDHATPRKVRLDEYHLQAFDEVIDAICAHKGFENPLPVEGTASGGQPVSP